MLTTADQLVFWAVVLTRFFVPLAIARYPLPAILAALVIDGIDQTVFQQFTNLPLEGYQGYDKALDVYYLTVAYISTLRNWSNLFAFRVSRFLIYYRLVGVALFELVHWRPVLLIFPNTFEYFFIFFEAYRLWWDPGRMTRRFISGAAAFIWIVIKLPQEYWIHIAQLDMTDTIRAYPEIAAVFGLLLVLLLVAGWWYVTRRLPPADHALTVDADAQQPAFSEEDARRARAVELASVLNRTLFEKIMLVSLVSIIFAQVLPGVRASNLELAVAVTFVITINTFLSHWLARRGTEWTSVLREFIVIAVVNFGLVLVYSFLAPTVDGSINLGNTLFFVLMLTLLVTLFDRYRQWYLMRFWPAG